MRKLNLVFGVCLILASSLGVRAAAPKLITEAPEGRSVNYVKTSQGRLPNVVDYQGDSGAAEFVFTDNGEVYIKGILSCDVVFGNNFESGYAKGIFEDGVIVLNTNQCISYSSERFRGYSLVAIKRNGDSWEIDKETKQIKLTVADDGTVILDENTPVGLVNVYSNGTGSLANIMEWSQTYKLFDHAIVSKPETLSTEKWGITSSDGTARFVEVGIDGNNMYIGGVSEYMPDAWIKGTIDGTQVIFDSKQYIGICNSLYHFHYNEVVIASNDLLGENGILPENTTVGEKIEHSYTFTVTDEIKPFINMAESLFVVAMVIDGETGKIVNAAKSELVLESGVGTVNGEVHGDVVGECYTDLLGRNVVNPAGGIFVRTVRYSDGTVKSEKVLIK